MSNHSGSSMLNNVLLLLEEYEFFKQLDQKKIKDFMNGILKIGRYNDCNNSEILEEIGEKIGFCYYCQDIAKEFETDICKKCYEEIYPIKSESISDEEASSLCCPPVIDKLQQDMSVIDEPTAPGGMGTETSPPIRTDQPTPFRGGYNTRSRSRQG